VRTLRIAAVLAAVPLVLAACSSSPDQPASSGSGGVDAASAIANRTFTATTVTEGGAERPLASDVPITIVFTADALSANAGCNTLAGGYSIADGKLATGDLASTAMACKQALMDQDAWLGRFLTADPTVEATPDSLTLSTKEASIELAGVETVGVYDTPVFGEDEIPRVEALCATLVADSATEQQAQAAAEDKGYRFRVLVRDGEHLPATMDHVPGRVNVEVTADVVTTCTAG